MLLDFDIKKAIAAAAYLIEQQGGKESMFVLIKKLYYADRSALLQWGKTITGDSFASMDQGPVVVTIYDLFKGKGSRGNLVEWNNVVQREGNTVTLRKSTDKNILSEREIELLEETRRLINRVPGKIAKWIHQNCPEWKDPRGSSIPIDPSVILRLAKKSEEEISEIEKANDELRRLNYLLGTR